MSTFSILLQHMFVVTSILTLPILALATAIGAVIAVLQAATSIQEQSLSVLPKLGFVGAMLIFCAPLGMQCVIELFHTAVNAIPAIVAGQ